MAPMAHNRSNLNLMPYEPQQAVRMLGSYMEQYASPSLQALNWARTKHNHVKLQSQTQPMPVHSLVAGHLMFRGDQFRKNSDMNLKPDARMFVHDLASLILNGP
jgi:hypothetical protein